MCHDVWLYFCRVLALPERRNRSCSLHEPPDLQFPLSPGKRAQCSVHNTKHRGKNSFISFITAEEVLTEMPMACFHFKYSKVDVFAA